MKPVLYLIILCFVLPFSYTANAQGENNYWCFGFNDGLNFNTVPVSSYHSNMRVVEGSAAVSDANGNLLFYSSGAFVWDRNGNLMPNGQGLSGNGPYNPVPAWPQNIGSSACGVAIIKSPSNPNQYYLLTTDAIEDLQYNAYYSVIDMSLNGGLGDVVPTQRNIVFASDIREGVVGVTGSDCSTYWAVLHHRLNGNYLAYKIDLSGFHATPVISNGTIDAPGIMRFNRRGTILARAGSPTEFASFDKATGILSSFVTTTQPYTPSNVYSIEFSPDDSKVYFCGQFGIKQLDFSLYPNITAMQTQQVTITDSMMNSMRLGPDGKIYACYPSHNYLSRIDFPNVMGTGSQFVENVISYPDSVPHIYQEMGNPAIVMPPIQFAITNTVDTVCQGASSNLTSSVSGSSYTWSTGDVTASITVNEAGKYWVSSLKDCTMYIDTFDIIFNNPKAQLGPDTSICNGDSLLLDANMGDANYHWQDGSTGTTYLATQEGSYIVTITKNNCSSSDTINIGIIHPSLHIIEPDTEICKGQSISLHALVLPESSLLWNTGSTTNITAAADSGIYVIKATNACGVYYDSVSISTMDCSCNAFVPNAFTPNADGNNDVLMVRMNCPGMSNFILSIYNRYGQQVFQTNNIDRGWDGMYNSKLADMGTYFYYLQYKNNLGETIKKKGDIVLLR